MKTNNLAFDDVGDRDPALLMMPGWCASRRVFRPLYPHLAHRAIALDWRGHGGSAITAGDFGARELVEDALAVTAAAGAPRIVPVAVAHAGWHAIELRRRLGPARVPAIVLLDWMVLGAPPPFAGMLQALQQADTWAATRDQLAARWTTGVDSPALHDYVREMTAHGAAMWARAGREIAAAFAACPVPLDALAELRCPTLHVYAQPADPAFLAAQQQFASTHPWYFVQRVEARSHFPTFEVPEAIATAIDTFATRITS